MQMNVCEFLEVVRPLLQAGEAEKLAQAIRYRWQPRQLAVLLRDSDCTVRRVAAVALGLIGDKSSTHSLARALHDQDKQVNEMAEHGLWSIWFRSGDPKAATPFRQGISQIASEQFENAIERFDQAISIDPEFSEAFNQCAMAHFFLSQWNESIHSYKRSLELMPMHFGAMAGLGHCYTELGDLKSALRYYRRAIVINPQMAAVVQAIEEIESKIKAVAIRSRI